MRGVRVVLAAFSIPIAVMVLPIDLAGRVVLFVVDLLPLLIGQPASIGRPIVMHLPIDIGLPLVGASCFSGGHLTIADSIRDALLLVCLAFIYGWTRRKPCIIGMIVEGTDRSRG